MAINENPIVSFLRKEVGIKPGAPFRGYADDAYRHVDGTSTLGKDSVAQWAGNWQFYGSGMKLFTWSALGIPTLSIYSPYIKPLYFVFFTRLLNNPDDQQEVNYLTISRPDVRMLQLAGMRYIVRDSDSPGGGAVRVVSWKTFDVYELPNPNLGSYTPTETVTIGSADHAIAHLRDPVFDPTKQVLVDDAGSIGPLVPSEPAKIVFERGGFHVTGNSRGRTLIVLPIEFTHCFSTISTDGLPTTARLIRVNIAQTGLLFERSVNMSVQYRDWPLASPECRRADYQDSLRLIAPGKG
jgi:hypothetical protein